MVALATSAIAFVCFSIAAASLASASCVFDRASSAVLVHLLTSAWTPAISVFSARICSSFVFVSTSASSFAFFSSSCASCVDFSA